ncbi:MAG: LysR family transcriptional regulator [Clostridia bacterium]|nr:LysR family transcriptional regulator [Clostridia bacterium]
MEVKCKIWIEEDGKIFGKGPYELLKAVEKTGSLSRAAKSMDMSYNKAFHLLKDIEKRLGYKLIETQTGGKSGGGSTVTNAGKDMVKRYEKLIKLSEDTISKLFQEIFLET